MNWLPIRRSKFLAREFQTRNDGEPDHQRIGELCTRVCQQVDPRYTDRFLAGEEETKKISQTY